MTELVLIPIAFVTSTLAGVMGMGGGILLIAAMPGLLPAAAILPIHAVTQLGSNLSRAGFGWRAIEPRLIPAIALGAVLGAWVGAEVYQRLDLVWLPAIIGVLILLLTWVRLPTVPGAGQLSLLFLGFYQTGLGMLAGATGPVGGAVLMRRNTDRDWLVVNTAVYMTLNHLVRLGAFVAIGFSFAPWWPLVLGMIAAVTLGSWVGTALRQRLPQIDFERWFRVLVTLLALRMIAMTVWDLGG
jgi:uncharacterized membrane protein YfcA